MTDVVDLNAEVLRAIKAVNYAMGDRIPTDIGTINLLRANLHAGDYYLAKLPDYVLRVRDDAESVLSGSRIDDLEVEDD